MLKTVIVLYCCIGLAACKSPADAKSSTGDQLARIFQNDTLLIESDDGETHEFDVYLALNYEQHRRGLMFVRSLPERSGMLFVYEDSAIRSIWMKNTFIPLDLVFARRDGDITSVIHDTRPMSLASRSSTEAVAYVLELNAGTARRYRIGNNSRLIWEPPGTRGQ